MTMWPCISIDTDQHICQCHTKGSISYSMVAHTHNGPYEVVQQDHRNEQTRIAVDSVTATATTRLNTMWPLNNNDSNRQTYYTQRHNKNTSNGIVSIMNIKESDNKHTNTIRLLSSIYLQLQHWFSNTTHATVC